jgi:hypothetical protein
VQALAPPTHRDDLHVTPGIYIHIPRETTTGPHPLLADMQWESPLSPDEGGQESSGHSVRSAGPN